MGLELYAMDPSVPCRMVRLLCEYLELDVEVKNVDTLKGEQLQPDFIQINPQHTIPTLIDDGLIITESRAILQYLGNKYASKEENLYPTEPEKRALIDMRLCFDLGTLYVRFMDAFWPVVLTKVTPDPAKVAKLDEALGYVEDFLKDGFIAGSELTIADFSMVAILSTIKSFGHDMSNFPEIAAYLEKCAGIMKGWEELNQTGADWFGGWYKASLAEAEAAA
ncbi:Glutathione S-transferase D7 [Orchesella cincta]|uniref:Glutathione S-transferase D7 n=1 Tax=Orchesella cincta TaxID=48709 RepID=A0A1D2MQT6_ORCCI|nr:Glutathione S-transferase D7 [Orchesella cincta]